MTTRTAFTVLVAAIAAERLLEVAFSSSNVRRALSRGGVEAGASHYPVMVALHAAFLAACPLEVWLLDRPFQPALGRLMLGLVAAAMLLRYWVVGTLGRRWTTRVVYVPGDPLVESGPFRWLRHPNYLAVTVEMFALPLVHGAWVTAVVFSAANALVLHRRLVAEEALLRRYAGPAQRSQA